MKTKKYLFQTTKAFLFRPFVFCGSILLFLLFFFVLLCYSSSQQNRADQGTAHLSNVDGEKPITLNGTWEYYENQFLFPSSFTESEQRPDPKYVQVPGTAPNKLGYGTYRLRFDFLSSSQLFALKISGLKSSARIYMDGELISSTGFASTLANGANPSKDSQYVIFPLNIMRKSHELIIHTANYTTYESGITNPLYFGTQTNVYRLINQFRFSESICIMSVCFLAILLILLLCMKIQIGNILYLLLFTICFSLHLVTTGNELITSPVSSLGYIILTRLSILTYSGMGVFMMMFINPNEHVSPLISNLYRGFIFTVPLILLGAVSLPPSYLSVYFYTVIVHFAGMLLFCLYILMKRMSLNRQSAYIQFLALSLFCSFFVLKYANGNGYLSSSTYNKNYTFVVVFVILQLSNVALRFSRIYSGNELLAQQMVVSDKMKDELMTVTSHELRTPLHGMINLIESAVSKPSDEKNTENELRLALTLARRMRSTINDLYGFHETDRSRKINLKPQNLKVEADAIIEVFHYTKNNPNLILFNHISPAASLVLADESKLWQILTNLVGNAIKYTPKGHIILASSRSKDKVKITVTDSGMGMNPENAAFIFDRNIRLPEARENAAGLGMGLYIARQLAEQMNGELAVEWTRPNEGTCISFTLDACIQEDYLRAQKRTSEQPFDSYPDNFIDHLHPDHARLLAVDDNVDNLDIIRHTFADCEFVIDTAQSPSLAADLLSRNTYDIAILDIMLPETNGFEICRKIRTKYTHFELPILLLTARDSSEDVLTGFWSGANDYIVKPANRVELRARVFSLIALHQSVHAAIESELQFLHAQIQPHFLYNAFNTISAIALSDGLRASELIDDLGTYLRNCFSKNSINNDLVPIANELEMVEAYVRIEQCRFDERLKVIFTKLTDDTFYVPLLSVQPIVENAIRHGSLNSDSLLTVKIIIDSSETCYIIKVEDNGNGMDSKATHYISNGVPTSSTNTGIGLQNVNRRFKLYYDLPLQIEALPTRGTRVILRIPKNR